MDTTPNSSDLTKIERLTLPSVPENVAYVFDTFHSIVKVGSLDQELGPRTDIAKMVFDFADEYVNPTLYDVALCTDIIDRLNNDLVRKNVKRSLKQYVTSVGDQSPESTYFLGIATDFMVINEYISDHLDGLADFLENDDMARGVFENPGTETIREELWLQEPDMPELGKLADLAEEVNLETILVKSVQTLLRLKDTSLSEVERFRIVTALESVYVPLCEITGFDALAATILDTTLQERLTRAGKDDVVTDMKAYMDSLGDRELLEQFVASLPERLIGDSDHEAIIDAPAGYGVYFSTGISESKALKAGDLAEVNSRIKALGSSAKKAEREGEIPADIIGLTVIVPEDTDVGVVFADVLKKLKDEGNVSFVPAPSRNEAIHIKGRPEFIAEVSRIVRIVWDDAIHVKENTSGFEVAKVTLKWALDDEICVPIEIQFMHKLSRRESRVGRDSHVLFKLMKYAKNESNLEFLRSDAAVECIERIHNRKSKLDPSTHDLNGASLTRADALKRELRRIDPNPRHRGIAGTALRTLFTPRQ